MRFLERLAEEKIREAMERGEFDSLPLAGRPLLLESNAFVPEDLRLAYKLLKDGGFLPPEVEMKKEIVSLKALLAAVEDQTARVKLARRINELVLRLNLASKSSFDRAAQEVYVGKLEEKLSRS
jgi:hypothetical protein